MACECKKDIEARLLARFKETNPEAAGHKVDLGGYSLILGEKVEFKGYMPIEATADFPLKKGGVKNKSVKQNMIFTFCPFCSVKY